MQLASAGKSVEWNGGKMHSRPTLMLLAPIHPARMHVPYKSGPGCSSVQTALVKDNGVSSERRLDSFLFLAFLFWRVRSCETGKESHETEQLFNCLQHKQKTNLCHDSRNLNCISHKQKTNESRNSCYCSWVCRQIFFVEKGIQTRRNSQNKAVCMSNRW